MTNDDDEKKKKKKNLSKFLSMLQQVLGMDVSPEKLIVNSMKKDTKSDFVKIDKFMDKRLNALIKTCCNQGYTMGGVSRDAVQTEAFNLDRGCDAHTTITGGILKDVCFLAALDKMRFSTESDGELYMENQLRPAGVNPSVIVRLMPVFQKSDLPALPESLDDISKIEDIRPYLCTAIAAEFFTILDKKREESDHFHYTLRLDKREIFDRDFMLSSKPFVVPTLSTGTHNFMDTLDFMDENPESGG